MTTFPDTIKVTIQDNDIRQPLPNIAIFIKLFATRKNDYYFMPEFSDENGNIIITKEWLNKEINKKVSLFIMDYASSLDTCYPKFEVWILSEGEVQRAIKAMNLYKSALGTKQEDIDRLAKVDNHKFEPVSKLIELHGEKVINVELKTKEINKSLSN